MQEVKQMDKKKFGLGSIILLGMNSIIGTGIFLLPGKAYALVGTSSLFVYIFITLLAGSMALCFAEVAGLYKSNGGAYIYVKEAFGNFAGFEVGVMKYVVQIIAWATMAVGFVTALSAIVPAAAAGPLRTGLILLILIGLSLVNYFGINLVKYVNNIATIGKLAPLVIFIALGIFAIKGSNFRPVVPAGMSADSFTNAAILIFYAFTGFESIATAAEDMENPKKNLPVAIASAMVLVSLIYFMIQFVSIGTLGTGLSTTEVPVVDAMKTFLGDAGGMLVTAGTLVSIGGINVAASFLSPRGCLALSERGMLPPFIMKQSRYGTPYVAILLTGALAVPVALSGSFTQLAAISVISRFTQYIPTCLSVIAFRKRGMKSTFRVPFGYTIPLVSTLVSIWLLTHANVQKLVIGLGAMVIIVPLYFVMKAYNKKHGYTFRDAD